MSRARCYRHTIATLLLLLTAPIVQAAEQLLIVGGGPLPKDSQVSIERNVIWIDSLTDSPDFSTRQLLFTAGPENVMDVIEQQPGNRGLQYFLPLARLFGSEGDALSVFRANQLNHIDDSATAASLDRHFSSMLESLQDGDGLWFIYNGHGGMESSDPSENTLRLWNDSTLDARRFAAIAKARPAGTILRSFMPQCFSGGFASSIALDPAAPDANHIDRLQCGFYSVPHNLESEGCTISVDSGEYRDYSTYFFAALTGMDRDGNPVDVATQQGKSPTLLDAHTWAYINGDSTDIPFSSSEYFLELWQPWYVRWQTVTTVTNDNPYFRSAQAIAEKTGIANTSINQMATLASEKIDSISEQVANISNKQQGIANREHALRKKLSTAFMQHFPEAAFPHTGGWAQLLQEKANEMLQWITSHPDYPQLEKLQQDIATLDKELLKTQRELTKFIRLQRMLKLATLRELFLRNASPSARDSYAALLACETWSPPLKQRKPTADRHLP